MTTPPTPPTAHFDPTEALLRQALTESAPVDTHVERGLADLQERVATGGATAGAPADLATRRLRPGRILAIAAVIVLVLGLAAAVVVRGGDDLDGDDLQTQPPGAAATGWYVPKGLSDDWHLKSVTTYVDGVEQLAGECPCRRRVWVGSDATKAMRLNEVTSKERDVADLFETIDEADVTEGIDLGHGITGTAGIGSFADGPVPRTAPFLAWQRDGTQSILFGNEVTEDQLTAAGRAILDTGVPGEDALPGSHLVDQVSVPGNLKTSTSVRVIMENRATGAIETYVLVPPGLDGSDSSRAPTVVGLPGAPGPLLAVVSDALDGSGTQATTYLGRWPGATITTGAILDVERPPGPPDTLREVLGSLRPATQAEWAAFLKTASEPPADLAELAPPTLMDLTVPATGSPASSTTPATTTSPPRLGAADVTIAPVLEVRPCSSPSGSSDQVQSADGQPCARYRLGSSTIDGRDLYQAEAALQESWVVEVRARPASVGALNAIFDACYQAEPTCPARGSAGRGAVAIVVDGQVINAPTVNGAGLADDSFTLNSGSMTEAQANELAAAINAG